MGKAKVPGQQRGSAVGGAGTRRPRGETRSRVFRYVADRLRAGDPPSVREIRDALGLGATQTVQAHLQALVAEGRLEQEPATARGRARGYRLPRQAPPPQMVPLLGGVQAGLPNLAIEEVEAYLPVAARVGSDADFALRVRGDSMRDRGILDGDLVLVRRQPSADDGDVVVALVEDEATVKTLRRIGGVVELHPANPDFPVLRPDPAVMQLLGRVVEVRRRL